MDLRVENPRLTEEFATEAVTLKHPLPWNFSGEEAGGIVDANGDHVLHIDVNNERTDHDCIQIAALILVAVNTCGGVKMPVMPAPMDAAAQR